MTTVREAIRLAAARLKAAGVPDAQADARILLCAAAGVDRTAVLRDPDLRLDAGAERLFETYTVRRLAREPVSRILGRREFWGLDLLVTPDVLDPRPDTETLVSAALAVVRRDRRRAWRVLDLGTGSGAILCALLTELPAARGWASDLSAPACRVAATNLARSGVGSRGLVVQARWGEACASHAFDLVVSNPPYVETATILGLAPDVRDHDPLGALDGGADGLDAYRAIAADLPRLLARGGVALVEVGAGQAADVTSLLARAGLAPLGCHRDLAGIERVVEAQSA